MDSRELVPIICLMPVLLIYSVSELRRGWKILKYGEYSLNPALQARIWLLKRLRGDKFANEYQASLLEDTNTMRLRGIYSLIGSLILMIGSAILIYAWLTS
jgi:hypothetical protein